MSSLFQATMERFIAISTRTKEQFKSKHWGIFLTILNLQK